MAFVAGSPGQDVAANGPAQKPKISEHVQYLVPDELVGKSKTVFVDDAVFVDDHRVLERPALDKAGLAQRIDVLLENKGAGGRDLFGEDLRLDVVFRKLGAEDRVVVLNGERDPEAGLAKFDQMTNGPLEVVYSNQEVTIYRVNGLESVSQADDAPDT